MSGIRPIKPYTAETRNSFRRGKLSIVERE